MLKMAHKLVCLKARHFSAHPLKFRLFDFWRIIFLCFFDNKIRKHIGFPFKDRASIYIDG